MDNKMEDKSEDNGFNPRRGAYLIIPYIAQHGTDQHEALINLFFRLKKEGLDTIVFHEKPDISLLEFMNFFSKPNTFLQVMALMQGDSVVDICGMAWLADVSECSGGILTKAIGSFLFFKEYQHRAHTEAFSKIILEYWFTILKIDTLVGLTPAPNRSASIFIKSIGMKEICRIPNYTTFDGAVCDGIVSCMTKDDYVLNKLKNTIM